MVPNNANSGYILPIPYNVITTRRHTKSADNPHRNDWNSSRSDSIRSMAIIIKKMDRSGWRHLWMRMYQLGMHGDEPSFLPTSVGPFSFGAPKVEVRPPALLSKPLLRGQCYVGSKNDYQKIQVTETALFGTTK